jgi:hypothetical protein
MYINASPAAVAELVVLLLDKLLRPAAQAPEQTEPGIPITPPIIPRNIVALDVPLTFAINIPPKHKNIRIKKLHYSNNL